MVAAAAVVGFAIVATVSVVIMIIATVRNGEQNILLYPQIKSMLGLHSRNQQER